MRSTSTQSLHLGEGAVCGGCWSAGGDTVYLHYGGTPSVAMERSLGVGDSMYPALLLAWELASNAIVDMATVGQLREGDGMLAIDEAGEQLLLRQHRSALVVNIESLSVRETLRGCEGPWAGTFAGRLPVWLDGSDLILDTEDRGRHSSVGMWALDVDTEGERVFVAGGKNLSGAAIHSLASGELLEFLAKTPANRSLPTFSSIRFIPGHEELLLGGWDGEVWRWPLGEAVPRSMGEHSEGACHVQALLVDGPLAASFGSDGSIAIWEWQSEKRIARISAHASWIHFAALRPESGEVLTGGDDGAARLWPNLESLAAHGDALTPHRQHDYYQGRPTLGLGRSQDLFVTRFGEDIRALDRDGMPCPLPSTIDWLHTANRLEEGVLIVGDKDELRLTTSDVRIGPVALKEDRSLAAIGMERRIELRSLEGDTLMQLALEHPAAAIEFIDHTLVALDEAGHVHTWEVQLQPA